MGIIDGANSRRYMHFKKVLPSAQGMGIWEDYAFILYDTGTCGVYNLKTKDAEPICYFKLGSYNDGTPTKDYLNHANSCMFGTLHRGNNPIPLLYVNIGTGIGFDADGYYYRCAVEDIRETVSDDGRVCMSAQTIQTISLVPEGTLKQGFEKPCWGCPAWLVDTERGELYVLSAKYRTTRSNVPQGMQNRYIVTTFRLPELAEGPFVKLTYGDILDQFSVGSDLQFTQGGTAAGGKIYFTYGCPRLDYPLSIAVFDLGKKELCAVVDHMDEAFSHEEIECCGIYQGRLLCNTCDGSIFVAGDGYLPL